MAESVAAGAGAELIAVDAEGNLTEAQWTTARGRRRHHFWLADLHGQRVMAVQEVCRRVEQAVVFASLEEQDRCRPHELGHDERRQALDPAYLFTLSQQHSMIWVGTGMMPSNSKAATRNDLNYVGSFSGAMA